jgi:hypothetical protein
LLALAAKAGKHWDKIAAVQMNEKRVRICEGLRCISSVLQNKSQDTGQQLKSNSTNLTRLCRSRVTKSR